MADFLKLIRFGDQDEVARFLKSGIDPNHPDENGFTPLMYASKYGFHEIVLMLINHGADVDFSMKDGYTALFGASENYWPAVVKILIQNGADVAVHDNGGWTPLHRALLNLHTVAMDEKRDVVEQLLRSGANANALTDHMDSPLHYAAELGDPNIAQLLLAYGADVDAQNCDCSSPLNESDSPEISSVLIAHGAQITSEWEAVRTGRVKIVSDFLNRGGDPNARNSEGQTPLHEAVICGYRDIVEFLIDAGGDPNISDESGVSPIMLNPNREMADLLLAYGAKVNDIHTATRTGRLEYVEAFLSMGISPNEEDGGFRGATILHTAAADGYTDIVDLLLKRGANIEKKDDVINETPLFRAVLNGHSETVRFMTKKGADVEARNQCGFTPLARACYKGLNDMITLLLDSGADINATDLEGETPLRHAIWGVHARGGANQATLELLAARGGRDIK